MSEGHNAASRDALERNIRRACEADELQRAMTLAIEGYGPELLGFLHGALRNEEEAREVFAQASEDMWRGLAGFEWRSSFRTWAYRVTRGALSRHLSHPARRRGERLTTGRASGLLAIVRTDTRPHLRTENKDRLARLREALDLDDRMLLILRIDRGLSWDEVVDVLESPSAGDVDGRRRAAARLRKSFDRLEARLREQAEREGWFSNEGA